MQVKYSTILNIVCSNQCCHVLWLCHSLRGCVLSPSFCFRPLPAIIPACLRRFAIALFISPHSWPSTENEAARLILLTFCNANSKGKWWKLEKEAKSQPNNHKIIVLRLAQRKEAQGVLEVRSMRATTTLKAKTEKDLRGNTLGLCFLCGILEIEIGEFSYLEINFWF